MIYLILACIILAQMFVIFSLRRKLNNTRIQFINFALKYRKLTASQVLSAHNNPSVASIYKNVSNFYNQDEK